MTTGLRKLNDISQKYKNLFLEDLESKKIQLEEVNTCICCDSTNFEKLLDVDRFDLPFGSYICKECGLVTTSPRIKQESLPYYYEKYYHPLNYGKESLEDQVALFKEGQGKKIFEKVQPYLQKSETLSVLEIGAGVGSVLDEFRTEANIQNQGVKLFGTEYSHECILQCKKRDVEVIEGNADAVLKTGEKFNLIILSHVFEHFIDLKHELETLAKLLLPNGILYIEVPGILKNHNKAYYDFSFLGYSVHAHMYNFSLATLSSVLENNKFSLQEGNEDVEAIFQIKKSQHISHELTNDYFRIKYYLEFLNDNQPFAMQQNEKMKKLLIENKQSLKYKTMVENRDKDIVKYKTMVENRDKDIVKYKTMVENRDKKINSIRELLVNIHTNKFTAIFKYKRVLSQLKQILGQ